jgi:glyoxylase-like metal-dependent hydrolase (beta-lactamase superfamily II)
MKNHHAFRVVVASVALLASATSSPAQSSAHTTNRSGRALTDYAPVLRSTLDGAWVINPEKGVETRKVADGVYVVTDGVWQSAFAVTGAGVVVFDAPETYAARIRAEIAAVTSQPITTLVFTHIHKDHIGGSTAFADIKGLEIVALTGVASFLAEKKDPNRLVPTRTFDDQLVLDRGGMRIELRAAHYHSDEGDLIVYIPRARFLMAIDTLAPGYGPFMGFDITSNFHEYLRVFDVLLKYDFDVFVGGHLTHVGNRADVEVAREFARDVYETVKRVHRETDLMAVFAETAQQVGGFDNKYLLFKRFLDVVTARATAEIEQRWMNRLAGIDVFAADHVRTALLYVRWDD